MCVSYFPFHSELDAIVPGIPAGPVSPCLHYFQNFLTPRLPPSDPEIWLAPGYSSTALQGVLELRLKKCNWAVAAARERKRKVWIQQNPTQHKHINLSWLDQTSLCGSLLDFLPSIECQYRKLQFVSCKHDHNSAGSQDKHNKFTATPQNLLIL